MVNTTQTYTFRTHHPTRSYSAVVRAGHTDIGINHLWYRDFAGFSPCVLVGGLSFWGMWVLSKSTAVFPLQKCGVGAVNLKVVWFGAVPNNRELCKGCCRSLSLWKYLYGSILNVDNFMEYSSVLMASFCIWGVWSIISCLNLLIAIIHHLQLVLKQASHKRLNPKWDD